MPQILEIAIIDWRSPPTAAEVRAHELRSRNGAGRWLCEATGKIYHLSRNGVGEVVILDGYVMALRSWSAGKWSARTAITTRWLPVDGNGLPFEWPRVTPPAEAQPRESE